ncbi:MAG: SDR family oxidoreductase [Planctomycetota bacterium]
MSTESPVYILIGGGGGIGASLAKRLADRNATLVLAGRTEERLKTVADEIGCETADCDATSFDEVEELVSNTTEKHGGLDGIVNLAGSILLKPAHLSTPKDFDDTFDLNVRTAFATVRAAAKTLGKHNGGSIVLMSSCAAEIGLMNHELIAAAKSAVNGLARSAAATYAGKKIRVNSVAPGLVETPMAEPITKNEASRKASEALHPLGRLGKPDDVAPIIDWLLSDASDWVTGQTIGVDGGLATIKGRGG